MSILPRNRRAAEFQRTLARMAPGRHLLIRANPFNCPTHIGAHQSITLACETCHGTGYVTDAAPDDINTAGAPFNTKYFILGDIQDGHGVLGTGGDFLNVMASIGKERIGDGIMFCPAMQHDPMTGRRVLPSVDPALPRPDRVVRTQDGQLFTVLSDLDSALGEAPFFRSYTVGIGFAAGPPNLR